MKNRTSQIKKLSRKIQYAHDLDELFLISTELEGMQGILPDTGLTYLDLQFENKMNQILRVFL